MELNEQNRAALHLLSRLIGVRGWTRNALDRELGFSSGYLSRLLTGNTKLLYEHILLILSALGVAPSRYFQWLHGSSAPKTWADVERLVDEVVTEVILEDGIPPRRLAPRKPKRKPATPA